MSIIRTQKRDNLAFFDRTVLDDENLSWRAKGIAAYLLSHPNQWAIKTNDLKQRSKDGRDAVLSGLKELEDAGYLERTKTRDETGKFVWEHVLHEAITGKPGPGFPSTGFQGIYKSTSYLERSSSSNHDHGSLAADFVKAMERIWGRGITSPYEGEQVQEWSESIPLEAWEYALTEAAKAGPRARNWRYLTPILNRVAEEGVYTQGKTPDLAEFMVLDEDGNRMEVLE